MTSTGEQALSQRLHYELDALPAPAAPVGAVIRRGTARRTRRWVAAASGLAAVAAVAVSVPLLSGRGQPTGRLGPQLRAGQVTRTRQATAPAPVLTGTMFAAGTADGRPWALSVRNIADPGARCLPTILLNASDGYLPPAGSPTAGGPAVGGGIASLAFLTDVPGQPDTGYAALRVAPAVTRLTAQLRDGQTLVLHPVTVAMCGRRLPLAGFSYPRSGVATITAYAGTQVLSRVTPPASLFSQTAAAAGGYAAPGTPGSARSTLRLVPGVWQQLWTTPSAVASGTVAAGRTGGTRWRISVQLGAAGDCFLGSTFGGQVATQATACAPIAVPPRTVTLRRFLLQQRALTHGHTGLTGYAGLAGPRTGYLVARLSGGGSRRVRPVQVGGRQYVALAVPAGRTLTGITVYDRAGRALGMVRF